MSDGASLAIHSGRSVGYDMQEAGLVLCLVEEDMLRVLGAGFVLALGGLGSGRCGGR